MTRFGRTTKRVAITVLSTAAVLTAGAGIAFAATGAGGHGEDGDHPSYHSSATTRAGDENGNEATQALALSRLAKITLPQAAHDASRAISGGTVTSVDLGNEGGNVVYTAEVVTNHGLSEVVVDAGNGHILAKHAQHDSEHGDRNTNQTSGTVQSNGRAPVTGKTQSHR